MQCECDPYIQLYRIIGREGLYDDNEDPFDSKNYYRRKAKDEAGLYRAEQGEGHIRVLRERLADLISDYRNMKDFRKKYRSHCRSCSLVTSAGRLLLNRAGEEIDSAECVIRMNNAPVVGYEESVGKRTTTRIVCFRSVVNLQKSMLVGRGQTDEVLIWGAENPSHGSLAPTTMRILSKKYQKTTWYSMRNDGEEKVNVIFESETGISRSKSQSWLSTGLFTILYALHTCDNITVYGMVDEHFCRVYGDQETPYHYYENLPWNECEFLNLHESEKKQGHRYLTEKALYRRFASMFNLHFRYPEWNLSAGQETDLESPFRQKYLQQHQHR